MPAYKDEQRNTWYAAFYYTDWSGKKRHKVKRGFAKKGEASEYEKEFLNSLSHNPDITFGNLVEAYLADMKVRLKPSTYQAKESVIYAHIEPFFKDMKISDIDPISIRQWQGKIMQKKAYELDYFSQSYLKQINTQLSAILNYAVKHYSLPKNPCVQAGSIGKKKSAEMSIWTQEQFEQFLAKCTKRPFRIAFEVLFYSGIREGEMLALTKEDIKPDLYLDINKTYAFINGQEFFLTPKTEKSKRMVSIPEFLYEDIMSYVDSLKGLPDDERIFPYKKYRVQYEFKRVTKLAGLPEIRVHDLRHSHTSMLINIGVDIKAISERLGHESVKTTWDVYSHLYPNSDRELADKIQTLRSGREKK